VDGGGTPTRHIVRTGFNHMASPGFVVAGEKRILLQFDVIFMTNLDIRMAFR
jgi:hypothetical protein